MAQQGTIALTNNGVTVNGQGTDFTKLKAGDSIVAYINSAPYTVSVRSVQSATVLTLVEGFYGPSTGWVGWDSVPLEAMTAITYQLAVQHFKALRLMNLESDNWLQMYTTDGDITVNLPDGSHYTGPSILSLGKGKVDKTSLAFGTTDGTYCQGNDVRLNTMNGKTGGSTTGGIINESKGMTLRSSDSSQGWFYALDFQAGQGNNKTFARIYQSNSGINLNVGVNSTPKFNTFSADGNYYCPGNITCVSLTQTSDEDKKDKIEKITSALDKVSELEGVTYVMKDTGMPSAGVLAEALLNVLPECVGSVFDDHDIYEYVDERGENGEVVTVSRLVHKRDDSKRSYTVEYSGVMALCVEAIKELKAKVEKLESGQGS